MTIIHKVIKLLKTGGDKMSSIAFRFNPEKSVETILYLASKVSKPDLYDICKLLYIVDKASLESYGRFVFGDTYYAFEQGATPSNAYDLLKRARNRSQNGVRVIDNKVIAEREPRLELFSKSDIECLDDVIREFGDAPFYVRADAAHDAAYYKAWNNRTKDSEIMPIESVAELFADADDLIDFLSNRNAD
ncbi:Panacea domain-containing protein [Chloroflexota bacterium]